MGISMEQRGFRNLTAEEMYLSDGQGNVSLFIGFLGVAFSPVIACICPPVGIGIGVAAGGLIVDNWP